MTKSFNRADLVRAVAEGTDLSHREAQRVVYLQQDAMTRALARGESVSLFRFGTLTPQKVPPREARIPLTGEVTMAPESARVSFRPAPFLKACIVGNVDLPPEGELVTDLPLGDTRKGGGSKEG